MAAPAHVHLVVHDLLGRRVAVLVDERLSAGRYEAVFDAGDLSSGTYLYRIRMGDFGETRRMVVLK